MKVLNDTVYTEHHNLHTEIQSSIAVNGCQFKLAQKDIILLSKVSKIVCKAGRRTSLENTKFINSIYDFNTKIKVVILQQRQDWEPPQIKDLRLVIPKDYTLMADNTIFYVIGIQNNYLQKTTLVRSTFPTGSYETSLDTSPPPKILSLHFKQINEVQNELDGQP